MSTNKVLINFTMHIEEDFNNLVTNLKALHFNLKRTGELVWTNPFDNTQQLSVKPMVTGSRNYVVIFTGLIDNLAAILNRSIGFYETKVLMLQYELYLSDYSVADCLKTIKEDTRWGQTTYNERIFNLPNAQFQDITCLLMENKITFMTRTIFEIKNVNKALADCNGYSDIFIKPEPFDLFTYQTIEEQTFTATA